MRDASSSVEKRRKLVSQQQAKRAENPGGGAADDDDDGDDATTGKGMDRCLQTSTVEVYLREDISCGFPGCLSCKGNARTGTPLNSSREFFTLPSSAKVIELFGAQFWEECARDVILCKSVETRAREKFNSNPRLMRAMRGVYEDARKDGFCSTMCTSESTRDSEEERM